MIALSFCFTFKTRIKVKFKLLPFEFFKFSGTVAKFSFNFLILDKWFKLAADTSFYESQRAPSNRQSGESDILLAIPVLKIK